MIANNPTNAEPKSQQDFISVVHPELEGGSGNLATTSFDLGIEKKAVGDGASTVKYKKLRTKKLIQAMQNTQPVDEQALRASGIIGAGQPKPKRIRVKKIIQGGDFNDVMSGIKSAASTVGDVVKTAATVAPYVLPLVGLGKEKKAKQPSEWNTLVAKVRQETGKTLKDTLKHIKENNLYQKKTKTKTGSGARFPFSDQTVNATVRPAIIPETRKTGNVKSLKYMDNPETVVKPRRKKTILAIEDKK